jgi:dual specificity protein kinase YAK1
MSSRPLLDDLTIFIWDVYHAILPLRVPEPVYELGRQLNSTDELGDVSVDPAADLNGHRVVFVNNIFQDGSGRRYRVVDVLGSGTYAVVYKVQLIDDLGRFYAMKVIKNLHQYRETGANEIAIHQRMANGDPHPGKLHVMMPISFFDVERHICLVLPLLGRSLFDGLTTRPLFLLLQRIRSLMEQLLQSLQYIHSLGIIHSDVKTDNIMFRDDNCTDVMLIDFGAASAEANPGIYIQSRFYRSPEVILGLPYDHRIDIWSAGCVATELFLDFAIFGCESEFDVVHTMFALLGPFPEPILSSSSRWQRFFDMSPNGFEPKGHVTDILLTRHCCHQVFEEIGIHTLDQLILSRMPFQTDDEFNLLTAFTDFVKRLLNYDPQIRVSARTALMHPFILGKDLPDDWQQPPEPRKDSLKLNVNVVRKASSLDVMAPDFLSLM